MFLFRSRENAQRKYVDLIKEAAAKWPNWDPPKTIYAGDFGTVNKKTGELSVEGNIYNHDDTAAIARQHPPVEGAEVDQYQIHSYEVRGVDANAEVGANVPTVQGAVLKCRWQFNSKRGAILLMHRARMTRVPDQFFTASDSLHLSVLKGKCVVYQVWTCPGYYMYLSSRSSERVSVSLQTNLSTVVAPGVNVNPGADIAWFGEGATGVRQHAYKPNPVYSPLFCLKAIRKPLKRRDESGSGTEAWHEADVPWDDLDEEGMSEPETGYDDGPDDDDDDDDDDD